MSLDEARNHLHAAMLEAPDHPGWEAVKAQEAAEAAARAREDAELYEFESVEAEESRSSYRMRLRAAEIPPVHYDGSSSWGIPAS